jgi:hypothetical protein
MPLLRFSVENVNRFSQGRKTRERDPLLQKGVSFFFVFFVGGNDLLHQTVAYHIAVGKMVDSNILNPADDAGGHPPGRLVGEL